MKLLSATLSCSLLCALCLAALPVQADPPPTRWALLLTTQEHKIDPRMIEHLEAAGLRLVERPLEEPLGQELLRQFHLVMLLDFDWNYLQPPPLWDEGRIAEWFTVDRNLEELHQYVEAGGGLWYSVSVGTAGVATAQHLDRLLGRWGARLLPANARDAAHQADNYCWTTNVAPSPVTEGVTRLYYPNVQGRWDDVYSTMPFAFTDERWQPIVRAMPGATTERRLQYRTAEGPQWFPLEFGAQDPPILAGVAEIGQGRVALFSIHRIFTFLYPYEPELRGWEYHTGRLDGAVLETGDGATPSDGLRLITNMLRWIAEPAAELGWGDYTPERYAAAPVPAPAETPGWLRRWDEQNGAQYWKVLIGARSAYSTGQGTVAEYAAAARQAGYSVLIFTEDLASLSLEEWNALHQECQEASTPDLQVIAGLDLEDEYQNRYVVWGQSLYPAQWMLTPDGRRMTEIQYLSLGLGEAFAAIHRPGSTPLPHQFYKHYAGLVVYTYQRGELVDNGLPAFQVQVHNMSLPFPLAVHEIFSPEEVAQAASGGHQVYIPADTAANAAWYLRIGSLAHYYEVPNRVVVSSGPMIKALDAGKGHASFTNFVVEGDEPITDVRYYAQYELLRRWQPNATRFEGVSALWPGSRRWGFLWIQDAEGRTAITPGLRTGQGWGFDWRCSDRQNFFATVINYAGNQLAANMEIILPTFGTREGELLWPYTRGPVRGENMAPVVDFPYFSPALGVTDAYLDQRYTKALFEEVGFDARPAQGTTRSRVYEGKVRYWDLHNALPPTGGQQNPSGPMLVDLELRLRLPVYPTGPVFPGFLHTRHLGQEFPVSRLSAEGEWLTESFTGQAVDLPTGGSAGTWIALTEGFRVSSSLLGFAPPDQTHAALPRGYTWRGRVALVRSEHQAAALAQAMGLRGDPAYRLDLSRGSLARLAYVAETAPDAFGIAGEITPDPELPYLLPVSIAGLNPHWPTAVWRPAPEPGGLDYAAVPGDPAQPETRPQPEEDLTPFGVFEHHGWALVDARRGGFFYAGHLVTAGDPHLRIGLLRWTADEIVLELNNPTDRRLETTLRTPPEIGTRFALEQAITLEPGQLVRVRYGN